MTVQAEQIPILKELITVRDWLRYGVSSFERAGLAYGHGTSRAHDEAAYLILHTLRLPIDQLEPWLDARLTKPERQDILRIFEKRISTRKPASYLTNEAWIAGHRFYVDERVIVPRSFIGELMETAGIDDLLAGAEEPSRVLDLCAGSGCLAIVAALRFPNAHVVGVDISPDALAVARRNVDDYGLADRVLLIEGDLFQPLKGRKYDLIISNPPYVDAKAMAALPPEYRHEPALALASGDDGLDATRRILAAARRHLTKSGMLIVEIGGGRALLESAYPRLPFIWLDTEESEGEVFALRADEL